MSTWLVEWPSDGNAVRVAVKDAIDLAGFPTWAGCAGLRDSAAPAPADAACLAGIRAAEANGEVAIVGKTSQTELCLSPTGINKVFGTPMNPLAPDRVPGGSSSGSAVAVANGDADIALGTDTGGSVRIPAACCGIAGLKTTWGRVSLAGVWPLAPSLDTVGPLARDVPRVVAGMALLEPGFAAAKAPATTIGRLRVEGVDPAAEDAVDAVLAKVGFTVHSVQLPGWDDSFEAFDTIVLGEFWRACGALVENPGVSPSIVEVLRRGSEVTEEQLAEAYEAQRAWRAEVLAVLTGVELLAMPTLVGPPPLLTAAREFPITEMTAPFNTAGLPALAQPIAEMVSLQLIGPLHGEELLCATGLAVEAALTSH